MIMTNQTNKDNICKQQRRVRKTVNTLSNRSNNCSTYIRILQTLYELHQFGIMQGNHSPLRAHYLNINDSLCRCIPFSANFENLKKKFILLKSKNNRINLCQYQSFCLPKALILSGRQKCSGKKR